MKGGNQSQKARKSGRPVPGADFLEHGNDMISKKVYPQAVAATAQKNLKCEVNEAQRQALDKRYEYALQSARGSEMELLKEGATGSLLKGTFCETVAPSNTTEGSRALDIRNAQMMPETADTLSSEVFNARESIATIVYATAKQVPCSFVGASETPVSAFQTDEEVGKDDFAGARHRKLEAWVPPETDGGDLRKLEGDTSVKWNQFDQKLERDDVPAYRDEIYSTKLDMTKFTPEEQQKASSLASKMLTDGLRAEVDDQTDITEEQKFSSVAKSFRSVREFDKSGKSVLGDNFFKKAEKDTDAEIQHATRTATLLASPNSRKMISTVDKAVAYRRFLDPEKPNSVRQVNALNLEPPAPLQQKSKDKRVEDTVSQDQLLSRRHTRNELLLSLQKINDGLQKKFTGVELSKKSQNLMVEANLTEPRKTESSQRAPAKPKQEIFNALSPSGVLQQVKRLHSQEDFQPLPAQLTVSAILTSNLERARGRRPEPPSWFKHSTHIGHRVVPSNIHPYGKPPDEFTDRPQFRHDERQMHGPVPVMYAPTPTKQAGGAKRTEPEMHAGPPFTYGPVVMVQPQQYMQMLSQMPTQPGQPQTTMQPGMQPMQPGMQPMQPGMQPMQPGMQPMQPGVPPHPQPMTMPMPVMGPTGPVMMHPHIYMCQPQSMMQPPPMQAMPPGMQQPMMQAMPPGMQQPMMQAMPPGMPAPPGMQPQMAQAMHPPGVSAQPASQGPGLQSTSATPSEMKETSDQGRQWNEKEIESSDVPLQVAYFPSHPYPHPQYGRPQMPMQVPVQSQMIMYNGQVPMYWGFNPQVQLPNNQSPLPSEPADQCRSTVQ